MKPIRGELLTEHELEAGKLFAGEHLTHLGGWIDRDHLRFLAGEPMAVCGSCVNWTLSPQSDPKSVTRVGACPRCFVDSWTHWWQTHWWQTCHLYESRAQFVEELGDYLGELKAALGPVSKACAPESAPSSSPASVGSAP